jgi:hypothetical protein
MPRFFVKSHMTSARVQRETERLLKDVDIELALHSEGSGQVVGECIR